MRVQFNIGYHAELTEEANDGVLDQQQLGFVVAANIAQDLLQTESCVHFDNCDFPGGVAHIEAEWSIVEGAGDRYSDAALAAFGALLHTTQDFYAHSNWIELHVDQSPIPVWDQELFSLPPAIVSGTWLFGFPKMCGPGAPSHSELNKDSPSSKEGSKVVESGPNQGKSLFDLAYATALLATKAEFARFKAKGLKPHVSKAAAGGAVFEHVIGANRALRAGF